jgi:dihydrofolate reductase
MEEADRLGLEKLAVIGGGQVYDLFLPLASELWITDIAERYTCDTFFRFRPSTPEWEMVEFEEYISDPAANYYSIAGWVRRRAESTLSI